MCPARPSRRIEIDIPGTTGSTQLSDLTRDQLVEIIVAVVNQMHQRTPPSPDAVKEAIAEVKRLVSSQDPSLLEAQRVIAQEIRSNRIPQKIARQDAPPCPIGRVASTVSVVQVRVAEAET